MKKNSLRLAMMSLFLFSSHSWSSADDLLNQEMTKELKFLVELNSGTNNSNGVKDVQGWIRSKLTSLGFSVDIDDKNLLIGELKSAEPKAPWVSFLVHADTVFEPFSPFQKWTQVADGVVRGPGVLDDKGGIVVAIEGINRALKAKKDIKVNLRFISSPSEEVGSPGLIQKFKQMESSLVLGFEPALEDGSIIDSRRGNRWYHLFAEGKEAHAGRSHKEGINACVALATKLVEISMLTDYKKDLTVSVGNMQGGRDKYNIVCGSAEAKIDMRFSDFKTRDSAHQKVLAILNKEAIKGERVRFELTDDCPPFSRNSRSKNFLEKYLRILSKIERTPVISQRSGGSADSNYFSRPGVTVIDGLGPVGGKIHTDQEYLVLKSLETRAESLKQFLLQLEIDQ